MRACKDVMDEVPACRSGERELLKLVERYDPEALCSALRRGREQRKRESDPVPLVSADA